MPFNTVASVFLIATISKRFNTYPELTNVENIKSIKKWLNTNKNNPLTSPTSSVGTSIKLGKNTTNNITGMVKMQSGKVIYRRGAYEKRKAYYYRSQWLLYRQTG